MRALLICPFDRTISEVEIEPGNLDSYYKALSHPDHPPVETFDVAYVDGIDCFVDDEGLLKGPTSFFQFTPLDRDPLAGRGLVTGGIDDEGNTVGATMTVDELKARVMWVDVLAPGLYHLEQAA